MLPRLASACHALLARSAPDSSLSFGGSRERSRPARAAPVRLAARENARTRPELHL